MQGRPVPTKHDLLAQDARSKNQMNFSVQVYTYMYIYTVKPLILASTILLFSDFTTNDILASIKVSIPMNGHVLVCNT